MDEGAQGNTEHSNRFSQLQKDGKKKICDKYVLSMPEALQTAKRKLIASRDVSQQHIFIGMFYKYDNKRRA